MNGTKGNDKILPETGKLQSANTNDLIYGKAGNDRISAAAAAIPSTAAKATTRCMAAMATTR